MSLLGPLPGILVGGVRLILLNRKYPHPLLAAVEMLLLLNLFNLLPFGGLDGERFLQRVIFSRHRVPEIVF